MHYVLTCFVVSIGDVVFALSSSTLAEVANGLTAAVASTLLQRRRGGRMRVDQWLAARRMQANSSALRGKRKKVSDGPRSTSSDSEVARTRSSRYNTRPKFPPKKKVRAHGAACCPFQVLITMTISTWTCRRRMSTIPISWLLMAWWSLIETSTCLYPLKSEKAGEWQWSLSMITSAYGFSAIIAIYHLKIIT